MEQYLLAIQSLYPGAGITVWNVWRVPYRYWRQYVAGVDAHIEQSKKRG